jgi:FkbM family methyltransferase
MLKFFLQKARLSLQDSFDISVHRRDHSLFSDQVELLKGNSVSQIIDVGANVGMIALEYARYFPDAKLICIEPNPELLPVLQSNLDRANLDYQIHNLALGDIEGDSKFNITVEPGCSSLHEPNIQHIPISYQSIMNHAKTLTVNVTTLDKLLPPLPQGVILKLDTQGHELNILKGARELLKSHSIDLIVAELFMQPMYQNISLAGEVIGFLEDYQYRLHNIYSPVFAGNSGKIRQFDAIFIAPQLKEKSLQLLQSQMAT